MGIFDKLFGSGGDDESPNTPSNPNAKNFHYLDKLIETSDNDVDLDYDIQLASGERIWFSQGIVISGSDLIIDGNGHTIDAKGKIPFFAILGSNVTFKNINFINGGYSKQAEYGAMVISVNSNVEIINCQFENTNSYSGGIFNHGTLVLKDCLLINNSSEDLGGAISNNPGSELSVSNSLFSGNTSKLGGAIHNCGKLRLSDNYFEENSGDNGGAVSNYSGSANVENCEFNKNHAKFGGAIFNRGEYKYRKSIFSLKSTRDTMMDYLLFTPEPFIINDKSEIELLNCEFNENTSNEGILNNQPNSFFSISDCNFENNDAKGIIINFNSVELSSSNFIKNIRNVVLNNGDFEIRSCRFCDNSLNEENIILNSNSFDLYDCFFENNSANSIVFNKDSSKRLLISECKFSNNFSKMGTIHNRASSCSIIKPYFDSNISNEDYCGNINNEGILILDGPEINDMSDKSIYNVKDIQLKNFNQNDCEKVIFNSGNIEFS